LNNVLGAGFGIQYNAVPGGATISVAVNDLGAGLNPADPAFSKTARIYITISNTIVGGTVSSSKCLFFIFFS
jgi:hypothetical protein